MNWWSGVAMYSLASVKYIAPGSCSSTGAQLRALWRLRWCDPVGAGGRLKREGTCVYFSFLHTAAEQKRPQHRESIIRRLNINFFKNNHYSWKKPKNRTFTWISNCTVCTPRENHNWERHTRHNAHYSAIHKRLKCPSTDERLRRCGTYIHWNITQPYKGRKLGHS